MWLASSLFADRPLRSLTEQCGLVTWTQGVKKATPNPRNCLIHNANDSSGAPAVTGLSAAKPSSAFRAIFNPKSDFVTGMQAAYVAPGMGDGNVENNAGRVVKRGGETQGGGSIDGPLG